MTPVRAPRRSREAGFTLIDMLFVVALTGLLMTMAIPGLMRARGVAQVSSALGTIRTVNSAQLSYAITCGLGFYAPDFPTLAVKPPSATEGFISADLATGMTFVKSGYNFSMAGTAVPSAPGLVEESGCGSVGVVKIAAEDLDHRAVLGLHDRHGGGVLLDEQQRGGVVADRPADGLGESRGGVRRGDEHDVLHAPRGEGVTQFGRIGVMRPRHADRLEVMAARGGTLLSAEHSCGNLVGRTRRC